MKFHSVFFQLSFSLKLTNSSVFDNQVVVHAENTRNTVCQNIHQVIIAAIRNVTFERQMTAVNNNFHRRIYAQKVAIQTAAILKCSQCPQANRIVKA